MKNVPLLLLMILICFPQLSETIYTPSLPNVSDSFSITHNLAQWTLSIYFIGFALGVAFWGNYSDIIGRRKAILRGLIVYIVACVGCSFSPSIEWFLVFRVLQAFGISIGSVVVQSILREVYLEKERGLIFSRMNICIALSPALGPFVGGYLADIWGWKSNFWVLVISASSLYLLIFCFLRETNAHLNSRKFSDLYLMLKQLFSQPRPVIFAILVALFNGIMFSYYSHAPFIFIDLLDLTPSQYGRLGIYAACGILLGSLHFKRLQKRHAAETIIRIGCFLALGSMLLLNLDVFLLVHYNVTNMLAVVLIVVPIFLFFYAFGYAMPGLLSTALIGFESSIGSASSIFGCFYYMLTACFNFLMGYFDNGSLFPMPFYFFTLSLLTVVLFFMFHKFELQQKNKV